MEIKKLIQICFEQGLNGKETDICVKSAGSSLLKEKVPIIAISLDQLSSFIFMLKSADSYHLLLDGNTFYFNAFYSITDNFPAPRIYVMHATSLSEVAKISISLEKQGYKFPPINSTTFSKLIDESGYKDRYIFWHNQFKEKNKIFTELFEGRKQNTTVKTAFWLSTDSCFVCKEKAEMMLTTSIMAEEGIMIGLYMCKRHGNEALDNHNLLEYLAKTAEIPVPFSATRKVPKDEMLAITAQTLRDNLPCEIKKIIKNTITAVRPSGIRIILRQDALNNYAYTIEHSNKKPIARIDSANHHFIPYGPDHIHRNLKKKKKNKVEPSFTYGFAPFDIEVIKRLVEEAESSCNRKHP